MPLIMGRIGQSCSCVAGYIFYFSLDFSICSTAEFCLCLMIYKCAFHQVGGLQKGVIFFLLTSQLIGLKDKWLPLLLDKNLGTPKTMFHYPPSHRSLPLSGSGYM